MRRFLTLTRVFTVNHQEKSLIVHIQEALYMKSIILSDVSLEYTPVTSQKLIWESYKRELQMKREGY